MKISNLFFLCFLILVPFMSFAQVIDERLKKSLDPLELKYKLEDGAIMFKQPVGKRTQVVYIDNSTDIFDKFEVRQVYSTVHESEKPIAQDILLKLLIANSKKKIGAFEIIEREGSYFVVFTAKIPPDLDATNLKSIIDIVAISADNAEANYFKTEQW